MSPLEPRRLLYGPPYQLARPVSTRIGFVFAGMRNASSSGCAGCDGAGTTVSAGGPTFAELVCDSGAVMGGGGGTLACACLCPPQPVSRNKRRETKTATAKGRLRPPLKQALTCGEAGSPYSRRVSRASPTLCVMLWWNAGGQPARLRRSDEQLTPPFLSPPW